MKWKNIYHELTIQFGIIEEKEVDTVKQTNFR